MFRKKFQFYLPMAFGLYLLLQGGALFFSASPAGPLLGVGLLLWVPACAYFTWRGYRVLTPKAAPAPRVWKQAPSKLAA